MDNIVFGMLASAIVIIIFYLLIQGYFEGATAFKYNSNLNVRQARVDVTDPNSRNFAYGMWININKLSANETTILVRPSEVRLFIRNGSLMITSKSHAFDIIQNFPLQKWVYLTVSIKENTIAKRSIIDAYIDGKLVKSFESRKTISPTNGNLMLGQFDAKLIGFKRWTYSLTPAMVSDEYDNASMKKFIGNYNIDISILKNHTLAKRFSVF